MGSPDEEVFIAAAVGDLKRLQAALAAGGNACAASSDERTPLIMAAQRDYATAELLLRRGADVNHGGAYHGSALMHFVTDERLQAARWLLTMARTRTAARVAARRRSWLRPGAGRRGRAAPPARGRSRVR